MVMTRETIIRKACSLSHTFLEKPEQAKYLAVHHWTMQYSLVYFTGIRELQQHPQEWVADALKFISITKQKLIGPHRPHGSSWTWIRLLFFMHGKRCWNWKKHEQLICGSQLLIQSGHVLWWWQHMKNCWHHTSFSKVSPVVKLFAMNFLISSEKEFTIVKKWMDEKMMLDWVKKVLWWYISSATTGMVLWPSFFLACIYVTWWTHCKWDQKIWAWKSISLLVDALDSSSQWMLARRNCQNVQSKRSGLIGSWMFGWMMMSPPLPSTRI